MAMAPSLDSHKVAVVVFAMGECPACEHYLPRFLAEVESLRALGYPFIVWVPGMALLGGSIPILIYDAASSDAAIQKLADRFKVEATPTTIIMSRGTGSFKCEGGLANNQIAWILMMALEANR